MRWLEQVMARVWPKPIHALGVVDMEILSRLPFHSCDGSSWEFAPLAFGSLRSFPPMKKTARFRRLDRFGLWTEVEPVLEQQSILRTRWRREMALLDGMIKNADR
jgi:hypothetical protein